MISVAERIVLSSGFGRMFIAFASGAVGALAMAPFNFWPAMFVPMVIAVWLLDGVEPGAQKYSFLPMRTAAWLGWLWGFGYFVAGLWWLGAAFLVDGDKFAALLPLGVIGLPAVLALFTSAGFVLARLLWSAGVLRIFALAFGLGASEWLRGHLFTGFPWNEIGMSLGNNLVLAQLASAVGIYGLNIVAIVLFSAPAVMIKRRHLKFAIGFPLAAFVALGMYGALRINFNPPAFVPDVKLRLLQPNVALDANFRQDNRMEIIKKYLALSDRAKSSNGTGIGDVTHLIWPESSLPTILSRDAEALSTIGAFLPLNTTLVVGAARFEDAAKVGGKPSYFNSLQVVAHGGTIADSYDKVHLVPFGEYLPLEGLLRALGLTQFVQVPGGFNAGKWRGLLKVPGLPPVSPTICYEAIFPEEVALNNSRAGVIMNVTVDTWYGDTPGPYQHLAQARLRAIEQGLPLVRDANSGISAVIDPVGRIVAALPLNVEDILDSKLPAALASTFYSRFGDLGLVILLIFTGLLASVGKLVRFSA